MKKLLFLFLFFSTFLVAQKSTILKGTVKNNLKQPIEKVSITFGNSGTETDENGNYTIRIPIDTEITLVFSHVSYQTLIEKITANNRNGIRFSPVLTLKTEKLKEIVIKDNKKEAQGITKIDINKVKNVLGPNAGVENILMTLPGVNNNNELSTQYNVRGGNFDENLVYVNGVEVYRPFLIRSGQQEGLSFINTNMIQNIHFSAGGFQARYGDKLSSVLDITYKKPAETATTIEGSFLGGSATFEGQFLDKKLSTITGVRYRDNSLFVNSQQIEVNFRPKFTDVQTYLSYEFSEKFSLNFLGNFSLNNYNYKPLSRRTRFGTVANPLELIVFYNGQEQDNYLTVFGAFSADYKINENFKLTTIASRYNTQEEEYFDIAAQYNLGEVDANIGSENFGEVQFSQGIGSQLNHARNDLDALITNFQVRGTISKDQKQWTFGAKYQREDIRDRIREWEVIDSLGFSIRPPHHAGNNQPYEPFEGEIVPFQNIRKDNSVSINRVSGFVQFDEKTFWDDHEIFYNIGIRVHNWSVYGNGVASKKQTILVQEHNLPSNQIGKKTCFLEFQVVCMRNLHLIVNYVILMEISMWM